MSYRNTLFLRSRNLLLLAVLSLAAGCRSRTPVKKGDTTFDSQPQVEMDLLPDPAPEDKDQGPKKTVDSIKPAKASINKEKVVGTIVTVEEELSSKKVEEKRETSVGSSNTGRTSHSNTFKIPGSVGYSFWLELSKLFDFREDRQTFWDTIGIDYDQPVDEKAWNSIRQCVITLLGQSLGTQNKTKTLYTTFEGKFYNYQESYEFRHSNVNPSYTYWGLEGALKSLLFNTKTHKSKKLYVHGEKYAKKSRAVMTAIIDVLTAWIYLEEAFYNLFSKEEEIIQQTLTDIKTFVENKLTLNGKESDYYVLEENGLKKMKMNKSSAKLPHKKETEQAIGTAKTALDKIFDEHIWDLIAEEEESEESDSDSY